MDSITLWMKRINTVKILVISFVLFTLVGLTFYVYNDLPDGRCADTFEHQAFYTVKNGIEYCFYRRTVYPYRIWGGVIGVK